LPASTIIDDGADHPSAPPQRQEAMVLSFAFFDAFMSALSITPDALDALPAPARSKLPPPVFAFELKIGRTAAFVREPFSNSKQKAEFLPQASRSIPSFTRRRDQK
jgi:hypothetical protein